MKSHFCYYFLVTHVEVLGIGRLTNVRMQVRWVVKNVLGDVLSAYVALN